MFPVEVRQREVDSRGLFICQDPELRSKILPLFSFDPQDGGRRPIGHGTAFRIDPWARCATAFHVLVDLFRPGIRRNQLELLEHIRLAALEVPNIGYGLNPIPDDAWRPLEGAFSVFGVEEPPLSEKRMRNLTELMAIRIMPSNSFSTDTPFLPVRFRNWHPRVGERIMALGYADLDKDWHNRGDSRPMELYLYGSISTIIQVDAPDGASSRPWPRIRTDKNWPGGMSGGPVFNEARDVVGIVSTGINDNSGTATYFSGWNMPERVFPSIDPSNPGFFNGYGVFNEAGALINFGDDRVAIEATARQTGQSTTAPISCSPVTGDYIHRSQAR